MSKKRSPKKHKLGIFISGTIIIGIIIAVIFFYIYGGKMLLRYLLGGMFFATITLTLIALIKRYGKKLDVRF